jgi:hypothetical protein
MEFFNHIHCKYTGIKGFIKVYNDAIKYRYMITPKALAKAKVLIFWEKHGLEATLDAFPLSFARATRSHASLAAKEFFEPYQKVFPYPFEFQNKLSPIQLMMTIQPRSLPIRLPMESKIGLHYTSF